MDIISRYFWRLDTSLNMKRSTLVLGDTTAANFSMPRTSFLRSLSSVPEVADACPTCLMQQLGQKAKIHQYRTFECYLCQTQQFLHLNGLRNSGPDTCNNKCWATWLHGSRPDSLKDLWTLSLILLLIADIQQICHASHAQT